MALHFVSTSVLSSEDGIGYEKEVVKDTQETRSAKAAADAASNKPLHQVLAEAAEAKQADYDAKTKELFAPPKALDEEDVNFLESEHEKQLKAKRLRATVEKEELDSFRASQRAAQHTPQVVNFSAAKVPTQKAPAMKTTVIQKKRRVLDDDKDKKKTVVLSDQTQSTAGVVNKKDQVTIKNDAKLPEKSAQPPSALSMFSQYSDSEED